MALTIAPEQHADHYRAYLDALLEGDARGLNAVIDDLLRERVPWTRICSEFVQRGLYDVGRLWERNEISVSVEHLAASATQVVLSERYMAHRTPEHAPEVVLACVPNEFHDVGTMILADVCEAAGWRAVLLGANTPTRDLLKFVRQRKRRPDLLALSITLPANRMSLADAIAAITAEFPDLGIIVGGQALGGSADAIEFRESLLARHPSVSYVATLEALEHFLDQRMQWEAA